MTMITEREMKRRQMKAREEKRRRVMRNRRILAGVIALIIGLILGSISVHIKNANAESEPEAVLEERRTDLPVLVEYVHEVKGGENLSYIARKYIEQYNSEDSVETVVSRIMWYNHLDETESTYHLQPGDKLVVPVFIPSDRNPYHAAPESKESQN